MLHYDFSTVALMVIITVNGLSSFCVASLDVFQYFGKRRIDGALYAELCVCHSVPFFFQSTGKRRKLPPP
jgi:hypothetical protein